MPETKPTKREFRDVYLAGPLFTPGERHYLEQIDALCHKHGLTTYLPHRDAGYGNSLVADKYFADDLDMLRASKRVIAVLTGLDVDAGTAWEIGYAFSIGKEVVGIREDIRQSDLTLMIAQSITILTSMPDLESVVQQWGKLSQQSAHPAEF